jgi:hypothetical protein
MNAADKRVEAIRAKARDERTLLSELSTQVSADLKRLVKSALFHLDDVEGFFLNSKILREPRTASALARWLDHAETVLARAIQGRKHIQGLVRKFGPNARIVG